MVTLISWATGGGSKGRCDARCHNAKGIKCHCCCGGHYHGAARNGTLTQKVDEMQAVLVSELEAQGKKVTAQLPLSVGASR